MRKSKFNPEQILQALRQAEAGLDLGELRKLRQWREENQRLKQVVADLTLDKSILREAVGKKW